ncbi:MAG: NUDIX domain-containing protein [Deltaproteobacteria bacterium]|nr:NUDIX domain-containing protein [Deltaproteobacteria bacterium]
MYRKGGHGLEVFLVHPGGPFWKNKDAAAWSVPKGEYGQDEDPAAAARREFAEETGFSVRGELHDLGEIRRSGKKLRVWAVEGDLDPEQVKSNSFSMEWPPRSGNQREFPEVDKAAWFSLDQAREKLHKGQRELLGRLEELVSGK